MTQHVTTRAATEADVVFLTEVVIEATLDQGRLLDDFDEVEFRAGFGAWTTEQLPGDGAGSSISVVQVDGEDAGRLRVVRRDGLVEKDNLRARSFWERCGFAYVGEDETEHRLRLV